MIPRFLRFYGGYTVETTLDGYARTFFGLINQMVRLEAMERMTSIINHATAQADEKDSHKVMNALQEQYDGPDKLIQQAETIRGLRNV